MLGCYGNKEIKTPNIDNLARAGVRFANSFCATPICSPSRATFFTGRLPRQHGIQDFLVDHPIENPPQGQEAPPSSFRNEVMISDLLAKAGYNCGYVGKWHMGNDAQPGHGYKYTYTMIGGSAILHRSRDEPERTDGQGEGLSRGPDDAARVRVSGQAIAAGTPFFLTIGYLNPHTPYTGHPQKYYDMYANTSFDTIGWEQAAPNALRENDMLKDTWAISGNAPQAPPRWTIRSRCSSANCRSASFGTTR